MCLIYIIKKYPLLLIPRRNRVLSHALVKENLLVSIPMGLQFSVTAVGSMMLQSSNNALGSLYVSGFTAGTKIKLFLICPFDAMASATSVFVGQNMGARNTRRMRQGLNAGAALALIYSVFCSVAMIFFGRRLASIFVDASNVEMLDLAAQYLRCMGYLAFVLGLLNIYRVTMQGMGFTGRAMFSGISELIARGVVATFFVPVFGYAAVCWGDQIAWTCACLYSIPACLLTMKSAIRKIEERKGKSNV